LIKTTGITAGNEPGGVQGGFDKRKKLEDSSGQGVGGGKHFEIRRGMSAFDRGGVEEGGYSGHTVIFMRVQPRAGWKITKDIKTTK